MSYKDILEAAKRLQDDPFLEKDLPAWIQPAQRPDFLTDVNNNLPLPNLRPLRNSPPREKNHYLPIMKHAEALQYADVINPLDREAMGYIGVGKRYKDILEAAKRLQDDPFLEKDLPAWIRPAQRPDFLTAEALQYADVINPLDREAMGYIGVGKHGMLPDMYSGADPISFFKELEASREAQDVAHWAEPKKSRLFPFMKKNWKWLLAAGAAGAVLTKPLSWFTGKDDKYNTIEGLNHYGIAHQKRRQMTDFGSGFRRLFGGSITKAIHASKTGTIKGILERAPQIMQTPIFPSIAKAQEHLGSMGKSLSQHTGPEIFASPLHRAIVINPEHVTKISTRFGMTPKEIELIRPTVNMHELSELHHSKIMNAQLDLDQFPHASPAVIADELLAAAAISPKTFRAAKKFRLAESLGIEKTAQEQHIKHMAAVGMGKEYLHYDYRRPYIGYHDRIKKITAGIEEKWLPKFSGKDDAYNVIEGLSHGSKMFGQKLGSFAARLRKKFTEFGSGWDKLRALVKQFGKGQSFEKFIRTPSFQQALRSGKEMGVLGEGGQGIAHLMETQFSLGGQTHSLSFVRKRGATNTAQSEIFNEAKSLRKLQDLNAPSLYGVRGKEIFMEHFEGRSAGSIMASGGALPQSVVKDLSGFIEQMHSRNITHNDLAEHIHSTVNEYLPKNIIITNEGRAGVIDFGMSSSADSAKRKIVRDRWLISKDLSNLVENAEYDNLLASSLQRTQGKLSPAAMKHASADTEVKKTIKGKIKARVMSDMQRATTAKMFEDARSGGKRHASFAHKPTVKV